MEPYLHGGSGGCESGRQQGQLCIVTPHSRGAVIVPRGTNGHLSQLIKLPNFLSELSGVLSKLCPYQLRQWAR